jgi:hypothetical protein
LKLARKYDAFNRNVQFLDEEAKADLEEVHRIINLEESYLRSRTFEHWIQESKLQLKPLSSQKDKVREKLSSFREEIERALSEANFLPEFNE